MSYDAGYDAGNHGCFCHITDGRVIEARYAFSTIYDWHGSLWLGSWLVKEVYVATQADAIDWCLKAWLEMVTPLEEKI